MKIINLNKKSDKELINMKKDLETGLVKASGKWASGDISRKETGEAKPKGVVMKGEKTKLKRDIKRNIAQLNTILNQRGLSEEMNKLELEYLARKIDTNYYMVLGSIPIIAGFILMELSFFLSFIFVAFGCCYWLVGIGNCFRTRDLGREIRNENNKFK